MFSSDLPDCLSLEGGTAYMPYPGSSVEFVGNLSQEEPRQAARTEVRVSANPAILTIYGQFLPTKA